MSRYLCNFHGREKRIDVNTGLATWRSLSVGRVGWRQQVEVRMGDDEVKAVFGLFSSSWKEGNQGKSDCIL